MIKICCQSPFEILNNCYKYSYKNSIQKTKPNSDLMIHLLDSGKYSIVSTENFWNLMDTKYELRNLKSILMIKLMIDLNLKSPSETANSWNANSTRALEDFRSNSWLKSVNSGKIYI